MPKIWLIGGTQESVGLAAALHQQNLPFVVTVTTEPARRMYGRAMPTEACEAIPPFNHGRIQVGSMDPLEMPDWLETEAIAAIVDASHPFAVAVSQGAIAAATQIQIPYLRFERSPLDQSPLDRSPVYRALKALPTAVTPKANPVRSVQSVPNLETLLTSERLSGQRTMLVLGYRMLPQFRPWQDRAELFARILPSPLALDAALAAGFSSDRLIALRPPVSLALETALWQHWDITQVIAKASGQAGGEAVKRQVSNQLGIPLWLIERPAVDYPQQTDRLETVLSFAEAAIAVAAKAKK